MSMSNAAELREVRVERVHAPRRYPDGLSNTTMEKQRVPKTSSRNAVYINSAYVGSLNSVSDFRPTAPPTSVVREQYWACSKWPFGQRILAITVGVLLGTVAGLAITLVLRGQDPANLIGFAYSAPD